MVNKLNRRKVVRKRSRPVLRRPVPVLGAVVAFICFVAAIILWSCPNVAHSAQAPAPAPAASAVQSAVQPVAAQSPFVLKQSMDDLAAEILKAENNPQLHAGVFVIEPETGRYLDLQAHRPYSAASMIKLPVLVAMLEALDAKKVDLKQILTVREDLKGGGSGILQWRPTGSKINLNDCARLMITISDNTATNMIIDLIGGKNACNAEFARLGLTNTRINNPLPDLGGTNTTSPYDLALLLAKVDSGRILSDTSRAWLFDTLEHNRIRTLLPMGIPRTAKIADKTGDIGTLVGDAGIITASNGKRYIAAVAVERPWNDRRANELIRTISRKVYAGVTDDKEGIEELEAQQKVQAVSAVRKSPRRRRRRHSH